MFFPGGPTSAGLAGAGYPGQRSPALPPPSSLQVSPLVGTTMAHPMQHWQWMMQQQQSRLQPPQPMQHWQQEAAAPTARDWWTENPGQAQTTMPTTTATSSRPQAERKQPQRQASTHPALPWFRKKDAAIQYPPTPQICPAPPLLFSKMLHKPTKPQPMPYHTFP